MPIIMMPVDLSVLFRGRHRGKRRENRAIELVKQAEYGKIYYDAFGRQNASRKRIIDHKT